MHGTVQQTLPKILINIANNHHWKRIPLELLVPVQKSVVVCHPFGIVILKKNRFSETIPDHIWKYRGQHDYLYYQSQPAIHNHHQQYLDERIILQYYSKNDYDRDKGGAHGIIHSGIPTPEKHKTSIILFEFFLI